MERTLSSNEIVALKRIKVQPDNNMEGFPITAVREIKILKSLDHPNIVKMKEIVVSRVSASAPPAPPGRACAARMPLRCLESTVPPSRAAAGVNPT